MGTSEGKEITAEEEGLALALKERRLQWLEPDCLVLV